MQKNVMKHQLKNFVTASNETLDKAYDRFQKLISQLEIHGAYVSKEYINQKFLRSLPPSWSQIALIMRNKPDIDEVDIDDLYNNLRVYEDELKRSSVETLGLVLLEQISSTPSAHDIAYSFLAQPTTSPQLENEDFQQMDGDDLEELDLRWQVAMLTVRVKKSIQRIGRNMDFKEEQPVSLDKSKIKCYNCHRKGHFARECRSGRSQGRRPNGDNARSNVQTTESLSQALVAQDGLGGYDWSNDFEVEPVNYDLHGYLHQNSSSSFLIAREKHNKAKLEIKGYEIALESLEARILGHEKNELAWGERLSLIIMILIMSAHDKNGLGFGTQMDDLSNKSETVSENSLNVFEELDGVPQNEQLCKKPTSVNETVVSKSKINKDEVIIKDWTSDDDDDVCAIKTVSSVKPNVTQSVGSTGHFEVKDCDFFCPLKKSLNLGLDCGQYWVRGWSKPVWEYWLKDHSPRMDNVRPKASNSPIKRSYNTQLVYRPKDLKPDVKTFGVKNMTTVGIRAVVSKGKVENILKKDKWVWRPKMNYQDHVYKYNGSYILKKFEAIQRSCSDPYSVWIVVDSSLYGLATKLFFLNMSFLWWLWLLGSDPKESSKKKDGVYSLDLRTLFFRRCDNETEFKNYAINEFCAKKGIKREFSVARTPQQNGVAERKNRTLIEAARTMLTDSLLPTPFWAEAVNTACYIPWANLMGNLMKVICLDTLPLVKPLEYTTKGPKGTGSGPNWMFDLDFLTNSMNYIPISVENQVLVDAGTQDSYVAGSLGKDNRPTQEYILLPLQPPRIRIRVKNVVQDAQKQPSKDASPDNGANADESSFVYLGGKIPIDTSTLPNADLFIDPNMPDLEYDSDAFASDGIFNGAYDDENVGVVADFNNMDDTINVSPIPT
ncbi:putative ribonuclease H-like domain-containing protein, partial [Tanacetum coccineum]